MEFMGRLGLVFEDGKGGLVLMFEREIVWNGRKMWVDFGKCFYMWFGVKEVRRDWERNIGKEYRLKKEWDGKKYVDLGSGCLNWVELWD